MNLEKRIKRHVTGRRQEFFAVTLPGFQQLCADELATVSDTLAAKQVISGGVSFEGRLSDLYLAALHCRIPVRVMMRLARFKATNFGHLKGKTQEIPWELFLAEGVMPVCHVTARQSRLYHTSAIAGHIAQGIAARWSELGAAPEPCQSQVLFVRLEKDAVTLSLDGCGAPLYQRGLKPHTAKAPLRETTAAGILSLAGFTPDDALIDPMCGSGTFSLEAALMAKAVPPGFHRNFAFMQWPAFRPRQWAHLQKVAGQRIRRLNHPLIQASDSDEKAVAQLRDGIIRNRMEDAITVSKADFFDLQPQGRPPEKGVIVLNPPYGRRLTAKGSLEGQYREIAAKLKSDFKGWRVALLVPRKHLIRNLGLSLKSIPLQHGGLNLVLLVGRI
jgi:putative N6-adenine-specific DNA methylase